MISTPGSTGGLCLPAGQQLLHRKRGPHAVMRPKCRCLSLHCAQLAVMSGLAHASHMFMHYANSVSVRGKEVMEAAMQRPEGQALITVCNHVAATDDPLVMSAIIPEQYYNSPQNLR